MQLPARCARMVWPSPISVLKRCVSSGASQVTARRTKSPRNEFACEIDSRVPIEIFHRCYQGWKLVRFDVCRILCLARAKNVATLKGGRVQSQKV
jgi:hypothetical protein